MKSAAAIDAFVLCRQCRHAMQAISVAQCSAYVLHVIRTHTVMHTHHALLAE
jgi:hypothetical protein